MKELSITSESGYIDLARNPKDIISHGGLEYSAVLHFNVFERYKWLTKSTTIRSQ